jgi:hypothetical protein
MYVIEAFASKSKFLAMRVTKEVHPTSPLSPGISAHCVIMNFTGKTFFLLIIAYSSLSSSFFAVRKSFIGKRENPSHLCMNRKVRW